MSETQWGNSPLTQWHSSKPDEDTYIDVVRQQRAVFDARITALDNVIEAARTAIACMDNDDSNAGFRYHLHDPLGCLNRLREAVAALAALS